MKIGVEGINVRMIDWPEEKQALRTIKIMVSAVNQNYYQGEGTVNLQSLFEGQNLGTALESVQLTFAVSGISRTTTHQLVRQRVGVGFSQESFRDHNISENEIIMPKSIAKRSYLKEIYKDFMKEAKQVYKTMIKDGIPYQDARFVMPMGTATYIVITTNFRALQGLLSQRLCNTVQWEINYVSRLMLKEIRRELPFFARYLKCSCEKVEHCTAYSSTLFPPCGFYPASKELKERKYASSNDVNGCLEFIKKDIKLGRKWIPEYDD